MLRTYARTYLRATIHLADAAASLRCASSWAHYGRPKGPMLRKCMYVILIKVGIVEVAPLTKQFRKEKVEPSRLS